MNLIVIESSLGRFDSVLLSHLEVLSEVLISCPPVCKGHGKTFFSGLLMQVRVSHIILLAVSRHSHAVVSKRLRSSNLSELVVPVLDHSFLLIFDEHIHGKTAVKLDHQQHPNWSDSMSSVEWLEFPINVAEWIFDHSSEIFEDSPSLC